MNAIHVENGKTMIDTTKCRVCGRCTEVCKQNAIVIRMTKNAVEHSIKRVEPLVDVKSE